MKDTQNRKINLLEKIVETPTVEKSDLELFFESICKTVQKLPKLSQAKLKMKITEAVNQAEIEHLQICDFVYIIEDPTIKFNSTPKKITDTDKVILDNVDKDCSIDRDKVELNYLDEDVDEIDLR